MALMRQILNCLFDLRTWIRKIQHTIEKQTESEHGGEEEKGNKNLAPDKVRAVISFDEETVRATKAEADRQHTTQESIKKATQYAVGAAGIYALISLAIWCQMIKQSKTADAQLRQSRESFRIDERASIEIESMKLKGTVPFPPTTAVVYEVTAKNFGKTVARDIVFKKATLMDANSEAFNARVIKSGQDSLKDHPPVAFPKSLGPNTPVVIPFGVGGTAPQTYGKGSKQETWHDYLIGRFDYNDSFGIPHWMTFCFVIRDASGNVDYCETGNDEDNNPELPPT
jgi:hypothetical protein